MLVLSTLHDLLTQLLAPSTLHTATILTPAGQLVSYAAVPGRSKDSVRVLAAVGAQAWQTSPGEGQETAERLVENELGRVLVRAVGVEDTRGRTDGASRSPRADEPVLLLVLNGTDETEWVEMQEKAQEVVNHLTPSVMALKDRIVQTPYWPAVRDKK
jgi:hypothetical protein